MLKSYKIANSYNELVKDARRTSNSVVAPSELKSQISRIARQFTGYG